MIHDSETNYLYLADSIRKEKYSAFLDRFENVLKKYSIPYNFLSETKDIWAVDYMPVQISANKFVQFEYNPDYLNSKRGFKTISNVDNICKSINLTPTRSKLVVDGGNVSRTTDAVIMCDKVFKENPQLSEKELIKQLKGTFEVDKLFFVPQDGYDITGHADGMVRFVDSETVLINNYSHPKEDLEFARAFRMALYNAGLDWIEFPYTPYDNKPKTSAEGLYLNYLQMEQAIIVPTFNRKEDEKAVKILESVFKGQTIATIDSNEIAKGGGILNCITWNIKTE
jgi:agmatine deiminase